MSHPTQGQVMAELPFARSDEVFTTLLARPGVRVERIVSTGQASPADFWYDQPQGEWVMVLQGAAAVQVEGEAEPRPLGPGDWLELPPHCRHRVAWTDPAQTTVWLAVHYDCDDASFS